MSTPLRYIGVGLTAALAGAAAPWAAGAQGTGDITVTPYVGVYAPGTDVGKFSASVGPAGGSVAVRQKAAFALGANASYGLTSRVALELGAAYAWSDMKGSGTVWGTGEDFSGSATENAYVALGSARVVVNLLPAGSAAKLRLGVGPAVIHRGGSAYKSDAEMKISGRTDVGGAVSLCTRLGLTKSVGLRLRAESYLYNAELKVTDRTDPAGSVSFGSRFQTDYVVSAGLQIGLGR